MSESLEPSLWRKLNWTPVRDLVRGRMTMRLDLSGRIARSHLPGEAQRLIERVVRRTRLWRLEQTGVADELIAHFHDGLDAGVPIDELLASFGDEKQAAKLIRRAKRRQRPLAWRLLNGSLKALGVFLLLYVLATLLIFLREPDLSVDYVAVMNEAAAAVPEDERAWPIYREALLDHGLREIDLDALYRRSGAYMDLARPGDTEWAEAAAFLRQHADLLDLIRRGASRPGLGFEVGHAWDIAEKDRIALDIAVPADLPESLGAGDRLAAESMFSISLPHLTPLRQMAQIIAADALLAAEEGDAERVMADLDAILGLARHSREDTTLISELSAHSIFTMGMREFAHVFAAHPQLFNDEQLVEIAHRLAMLDRYREPNFAGERLWFLDMFQRIYDDDGRLTYPGLRFLEQMGSADIPANNDFLLATLPAFAVLIAPHDEMVAQYDRLMDMSEAHAALPLWEQLRTSSGVYEVLHAWKTSPIDHVRYCPLVYLMSALARAGELTHQTIAVRDALVVAIALELHRRDHGEYPASVDALVPRYLPMPAVDHSTGEPLLYRIVDGQPLLYGRGLDGDDDGGAVTEEAVKRWPHVPEADDWVLFPPPILTVEPTTSARERYPYGPPYDADAASPPDLPEAEPFYYGPRRDPMD